ncbi:MAG: hypothetical protein KIT14_20555 [bacterium]|nr:hypothetical protein [bacterium]
MHLARALTAADGAVMAGVGTRLTPSLLRALRDQDVERVWVSEDAVAPWEVDVDLEQALADLDARFAREAGDPVLAAVHTCLRNRMIAREQRLRVEGDA